MIDKSEIGKNIKQLLQGYADETTDVSITLRTPEEADVYLDGEYFNTFSVSKKRFLYNIPDRGNIDETFQISVTLRKDGVQHKEYHGAQLQLPASVYEIKDAYQRARMKNDDEPFSISKCELYGENISDILPNGKEALKKLNYLARIMKRFTEHKHSLLRGYIRQRGLESLTVDDLINMTYNLQDCDVIYEIHSDEELGKFYADNGMLQWLENTSEDVWKYLNYASIGQDIREKENGIFTEDGYFYNTAVDYVEPYNGEAFPEEFENDEYIFKLLISPKHDAEASKQRESWLTLPASKAEREAFLQRLGETRYEDCILLAVQSMETVIPMLVEGIEQLGRLNALAYKIRDMDRNGTVAKFKAVLASGKCRNLEDVVDAADHQDLFELYPEPSSLIEYAKQIYHEKYASILPVEFEKHFDFASYAEELRQTGDFAVTEYGVLKDLRPNRQLAIAE